MLDVRKDCAIKLFGKTIAWFPEEVGSDTTVTEKSHSCSAMSTSLDGKDVSGGDFTGCRHDECESINPTEEALTKAATPSEISNGPSAPGLEKDCLSPNTSKKEVPSESSAYQEKTLKRPNKILPCPRCNSMDTKFCYYNNYNVNQPRHFCRNCQRYWTSGGTMRNVPVGSGRRKNKSVAIQNYGHIMISDTLQAARVDAMNGVHLSSLKPNGFLTFGSDRHICEPMTSTLNYAERSQNRVSSEFCENSNGSSSPTSSSMEKTGGATMQESSLQNFQDKPSQVPCFPQHLWPCPWKSAPCMTPKPPSASGPCGFPVTFYPAKTFWGSAIPNPWNVPWASSASTSDPSALSMNTTSSALGKPSREEARLRTSKLGNENLSESTERSVLIPKTLRIDDPNEAAKSSIWSTLGIENEKTGSVNGIGLFQTCEPKGGSHSSIGSTTMTLQANPAALSRSLNFHERIANGI